MIAKKGKLMKFNIVLNIDDVYGKGKISMKKK